MTDLFFSPFLSFCHSFFLPFVSCFDADLERRDRYLLKVVIPAVNSRAAGFRTAGSCLGV